MAEREPGRRSTEPTRAAAPPAENAYPNLHTPYDEKNMMAWGDKRLGHAFNSKIERREVRGVGRNIKETLRAGVKRFGRMSEALVSVDKEIRAHNKVAFAIGRLEKDGRYKVDLDEEHSSEVREATKALKVGHGRAIVHLETANAYMITNGDGRWRLIKPDPDKAVREDFDKRIKPKLKEATKKLNTLLDEKATRPYIDVSILNIVTLGGKRAIQNWNQDRKIANVQKQIKVLKVEKLKYDKVYGPINKAVSEDLKLIADPASVKVHKEKATMTRAQYNEQNKFGFGGRVRLFDDGGNFLADIGRNIARKDVYTVSDGIFLGTANANKKRIDTMGRADTAPSYTRAIATASSTRRAERVAAAPATAPARAERPAAGAERPQVGNALPNMAERAVAQSFERQTRRQGLRERMNLTNAQNETLNQILRVSLAALDRGNARTLQSGNSVSLTLRNDRGESEYAILINARGQVTVMHKTMDNPPTAARVIEGITSLLRARTSRLPESMVRDVRRNVRIEPRNTNEQVPNLQYVIQDAPGDGGDTYFFHLKPRPNRTPENRSATGIGTRLPVGNPA